MSSELSRLAAGNGGIVGIDPTSYVVVSAVGCSFDYLEICRHKSWVPGAQPADGPDNPELVRPASDGFLEVGVGRIDGINVVVAIDDHWREPHWERYTGTETVLGHLTRIDHFQSMVAEVIHVEGCVQRGSADFVPIETPTCEDFAAEAVEGEQRLRVWQLYNLWKVESGGRLRVQGSPVIGNLCPAHSLAQHRKLEDAPARGVIDVEFQPSLVEPHLEDTGLPGDLHPPTRQDQRALRFSHRVPSNQSAMTG